VADGSGFVDRSEEIDELLDFIEEAFETPIIAIETVVGALIYLVKTNCLVDDKRSAILSMVGESFDGTLLQ
jgi:hypothetical protein